MKKKNKKAAETEAFEARGGNPQGMAKAYTLADITDDDMTITKSEPTPIPYGMNGRPSAPAPQQQAFSQRPAVLKEEREDEKSSLVLESAMLKPVPGGLQPIIAPKGQVQLQPVVVPVAFVPYSTQNQPLLQQYGKKPAPQAAPRLQEVSDQPLDNKAAQAAKKREKAPKFVGEETNAETAVKTAKKTKLKTRMFSSVLFLLTLVFFAAVILNFFADKIGLGTTPILSAGEPNIIAGWMNFDKTDIISQIPLFIFTAACAVALVALILSFVSICTGRGFHLWIAYAVVLVILLVGTLLCALDVLKLNIGINPIGENSFAWRLVMVAFVLTLFGLITMPRKPRLDDDLDDLSDLI